MSNSSTVMLRFKSPTIKIVWPRIVQEIDFNPDSPRRINVGEHIKRSQETTQLRAPTPNKISSPQHPKLTFPQRRHQKLMKGPEGHRDFSDRNTVPRSASIRPRSASPEPGYKLIPAEFNLYVCFLKVASRPGDPGARGRKGRARRPGERTNDFNLAPVSVVRSHWINWNCRANDGRPHQLRWLWDANFE